MVLPARRHSAFVALLLTIMTGMTGACADSPSDPARTPTSLELSESALSMDDGTAVELRATLRDQNGQPFFAPPAGYSVSWSSTDASIASVGQTGIVQANRPGLVEVRARASSLQASASVTVLIVPTMLRVEAPPQQGTVGTALPNPIVVWIADRHDTGVPGVEVEFDAGQGGSFAPATSVTDANGVAQSTWTLGGTAGAQSATISSPGLPDVTVTVEAVPESPLD